MAKAIMNSKKPKEMPTHTAKINKGGQQIGSITLPGAGLRSPGAIGSKCPACGGKGKC